MVIVRVYYHGHVCVFVMLRKKNTKTMDQSHSNTSQSKSADRKTIEKNRRIQMKALYLELNSLLPQTSRVSSSPSSSWSVYNL